MIWTSTKRVFKAGFINFWRNGFVSLASVLVMIITLLVIGSIMFSGVLLDSALTQIKNKVDINVYFVNSASPTDIQSIQTSLQALPQVAQVTYISADQALTDFKTRHQDDQLTLQALDELDSNPLGAELNIKAKDPSQYASIATFLQSKSVSSSNGLSIIDQITYNQNQVAIDTLTNIIHAGERLGLFLTILLIAISIVITFNTIRLAIYVSREEIAVMRLVGASSTFVRGPFVIVGIMYGIVATIITILIFYPVTFYLGRATANFFTGINIFDYYIKNFPQIFLILLGSGVVIGAISSFWAVRRYLKV